MLANTEWMSSLKMVQEKYRASDVNAETSGKIIIARDVSSTASFKQFAVVDQETVHQILSKRLDMHLYSVNSMDTETEGLFFLDLEKAPISPENTSEETAQVGSRTLEALKARFGEEMQKCAMYTDSRASKISIHVYCDVKMALSEMKEEAKHFLYADLSVYRPNGLFRLPFQSKKYDSSSRPLSPILHEESSSLSLCIPFPFIVVRPLPPLHLFPTPSSVRTAPLPFISSPPSQHEAKVKEEILLRWPETEGFRDTKIKENVIILEQHRPAFCYRHKGKHSSAGVYVFYFRESKKVKQICFAGSCGGKAWNLGILEK